MGTKMSLPTFTSSAAATPSASFRDFHVAEIKEALDTARTLTCSLNPPPSKSSPPPSPSRLGAGSPTLITPEIDIPLDGNYVLGFHLLVHRSLLKLGSLPRWPPDTQPTPFDIPSTTLPSTFSLSPPLNYFTLTTLYSSRFKILLSLPPKPPATSPVFVLAPVSSFYRVYNLLKRIAEAYQAGSLANTADGPKVDVKLGDDSDSQRKAAARKLQNHELDTECPICMEAKVEVACADCASAFCQKCRADWQASVMARSPDATEVVGCAVCHTDDGGPPDPPKLGGGGGSWHFEQWTQSDLVEEVDELEGLFGKEIEKLRSKGVLVTGGAQIEGFYEIKY
ncbi:hypothetical protein TeGR_g14987 [Tetraparma gracilis]|uniref:RING-type domain-containing protein n=1 Tax=Tetraparma gracilis TaxID=2962635 RepID=A0ABQ6N7M0_9STRA|nr:hypothetical protein TeGR_g14987 [Tetraparma gracilis]